MSEGYGTKRFPGKVLATSGWCMTTHHDWCQQYYFGKWGTHDCSCDCHKEKS